jgi:hypothetical protein
MDLEGALEVTKIGDRYMRACGTLKFFRRSGKMTIIQSIKEMEGNHEPIPQKSSRFICIYSLHLVSGH